MKLLLISLLAGANLTQVIGAEMTNSVGMKLARIEPGTFIMGQDGPAEDYQMMKHPTEFDHASWDEKPAHKVTITQPFYMGETEVTLGQYRKFKPGHLARSGDNEAATRVSWNDAVAFCEWLSKKEGKTYRLPTEAEWEYACRAGTTTLFYTGDTLPAGFQRWFGNANGRNIYFTNTTMPPEYQLIEKRASMHVAENDHQIIDGPVPLQVAQRPANAWGLFDMVGNIGQWCADWYGPYEASAETDPRGRSGGDFRVFRGGTHSVFVRQLRSASRSAWIPESANDVIGFRVVLGDVPKGALLAPPPPPFNSQNVSQTPAVIQKAPEAPFFSGPKPYVLMPTNFAGPMFSWHNHNLAITECPNGDLLAVSYSCVDESGSELCNIATRLRRGATEWDPESPFWDGPNVNDHAPRVWWDGKQTIFHFSRGLAEDIMRTSIDNGATWSKASIICPFGELGNKLIRTRENYFLMIRESGSQSESFVISRDEGKTWSTIEFPQNDTAEELRPGGISHRPAGIHDTVVQLNDGRIMIYGRQDKKNDQARFNGKTPISITADWGKTWTNSESEFPAISSAQRAAMIRLHDGALVFCSYTEQGFHWQHGEGMRFKAADGSEFTGHGLFAAVSFDDGKTWPMRRLITPGGPARTISTIDRSKCVLSDTMAEPTGYLCATETRDGLIQLINSKNHYVFNLGWLKTLPPAPEVVATSK